MSRAVAGALAAYRPQLTENQIRGLAAVGHRQIEDAFLGLARQRHHPEQMPVEGFDDEHGSGAQLVLAVHLEPKIGAERTPPNLAFVKDDVDWFGFDLLLITYPAKKILLYSLYYT